MCIQRGKIWCGFPYQLLQTLQGEVLRRHCSWDSLCQTAVVRGKPALFSSDLTPPMEIVSFAPQNGARQMVASTRLLRHILRCVPSLTMTLVTLMLLNSSTPITKDVVFKLASDRENSVKELEISYDSATPARAEIA